MAYTEEERLEAKRIARRDYERRRRAADPEGTRERQRQWREKNRDKYLAQARAQAARHRAANPDKVKAGLRRWYRGNKDKVRCLQLRRDFGITLEQWQEKFAAQGFKCDCCGSTDPKHKRGWQTDHDHFTGKLRGLICHPCNIVLTEDVTQARLDALKTYLQRHGSQ